ncbi:hypothetical protein BA895_06715 [Humibacillus sp. DSM 29435]|uniref:DUF1697 domain-containing protein n=1 Tax=Humibacillus sp. DSM 29435 TaxID=1869167 RepID=UPI0008728767|nr:DUF1697 domain-containing protein [Humibacillus sp. DSM 29435]OFE15397.1 hypothetical protein BA895_06715 [Humibacillus sp. DSM 29435]
MATWIVFLRAVNVGRRSYPMAELRQTLTDAGYANVETHIQTGNVRLTSGLRSRAKLEAAVEKVLEADRGFEVPVVALTPVELAALAADVEIISSTDPPSGGHYVSLLKATPTAGATGTIEADPPDGERLVVRGRSVHLLYDKPYHEAKRSNAWVEKAMGVATNRNAKVIRALAQKWGS